MSVILTGPLKGSPTMSDSKARITQVERVYFSPKEGPPTAPLIPSCHRWLETDEQPWTRQMTVGEGWQPLDCGWIKKCSLMVLVNQRDQFEVNPTPEEKEDTDGKVVEMCLASSFRPPLEGKATPRSMFSPPKEPPTPAPLTAQRLIYPGEHDKGCPVDLADIRIRCRKGTCTVVVHLFPT